MKTASRYALAYLLWALTIVAMVVVALLARDALMNSLTMSSVTEIKPGAIGALDASLRLRAVGTWSYPILGVILVVLVVFLEHYYRTAATTTLLLARFVKVAALTLIVLFVGHLVFFLTSRATGVMDWAGVLLPALELVVVGLLFGIYAWLRRRPVSLPTP